MSAQAGIFYFDQRPVPREIARRLLASLRGYGGDDCGMIVRPGLVMVHHALHVTHEDAREHQPLVSGTNRVMTWDGRLDNRLDLLAQHERIPGVIGMDERTDAALALSTLAHHGTTALRRLIGDWSLACFADQTLLLASDFAGNRPLFYWSGPDAVHWSTSLAELLARVPHDPALDARYLVGFLTSTMPPEVTPYAGILSVRPAHAIVWSRDGRKSMTRFWNAPADEIRYAREEEYEAHLRHLFAESVRGRLRSSRPVWLELSGGLDSTAVCCMAARLAADGLAETPSIQAITAVSESSRESDEGRFAQIVQRHCRLDARRVSYERASGLVDDEQGWTSPKHPSEAGLTFLRTVAADGARTLITGHPGDLVMGNVPDRGLASLDAWHDGSLRGWLHFARTWSRRTRMPIWSLLGALHDYTSSSDHLAIRTTARELQIRGTSDVTHIPPRAFVTATADAFTLRPALSEHWLDEIHRRATITRAFPRASRRPFIESLQIFTDTRLLESPNGFARVRQTHAYMHRPLVEFVLAIPARVLLGAHEPRRLMRRAFADLMPPEILRRFSKGHAAPLLMRQLRTVASTWLSDLDRLHIVQHHLIDPDRLRVRLRALADGSARQTANLRELVLLERWFRLRARRRGDETQPFPLGRKEHER